MLMCMWRDSGLGVFVHCISILLIFQKPKINKRTILLRFLGIILRVLRLEVSVYNVYITNQFQTTFAHGWGVKYVSGGDCEYQGGKLLRLLSQLRPRIRPQDGAYAR
jgi:hypothetical protein